MKKKISLLLFFSTSVLLNAEVNISQIIKIKNKLLAEQAQTLSKLTSEINASEINYLRDMQALDKNISALQEELLQIQKRHQILDNEIKQLKTK